MQQRYRWICVAALLLTTSACRNVLNMETTYDLQPGDIRKLTTDPISKEQTVKVNVTATAGTVNVYVCLESEIDAVMKDADSSRASTKALKSELKTANVGLEVSVPANAQAVVVIAGVTKATKVTVKITN